MSTSYSLLNHTQIKASIGKDVPATNGTVEGRTFLLRPNTRYPSPRAMALLHTPTTTDVDSPSFETNSEVRDLASGIGSLYMTPNTPAVLSSPPTLHEIGAEHEHEHSDHEGYSSESSFAIIDKDGEAQDGSIVQKKRRRSSPPFSYFGSASVCPCPGLHTDTAAVGFVSVTFPSSSASSSPAV